MTLPQILTQQRAFAPVLPADVLAQPLLLDFTGKNKELDAVDLTDTRRFSDYVFGKLRDHGATVGVGGYDENRSIYRRSTHFQQTEEPRCIHLGVDLWAVAGTPVFAPLAGRVHSFGDNARFGDYGPTLILEHRLPVPESDFTMCFYTLYGHLSRASLAGKWPGMTIKLGEKMAEIGPFPENGDWPPHLHIQVIADLQGWQGDYPGVCAELERESYLRNCPDPNLILRL